MPTAYPPAGNWIVFARRIAADQRTTLWVVHADGSGLRQVTVHGQPACGGPIADPTSRGCFAPRWSPDGRKIVFTNFNAIEGRSIYIVNADGSGLARVTDGGDDGSADWGIHPLAH